MSDTPYKQPILALILRVFGILAAAIAFVALGVIVVGVANGNGTAGVLVSLPVLVSAVVSALLLFGVAQVIDYVGRTAHASEEAAVNAQASTDLLRQLIRAYGHEPEA
jgi:flagellar motor component MotA